MDFVTVGDLRIRLLGTDEPLIDAMRAMHLFDEVSAVRRQLDENNLRQCSCGTWTNLATKCSWCLERDNV